MAYQTSPSAVPGDSPPKVLGGSLVEQLLSGVSYWSLAVTLLALCVTYDQGESVFWQATIASCADFIWVLVARYQWNKWGNIVGPAFKLPFMGPFLESINPKFEQYAAKWASGPLSCVSVFHKSVTGLHSFALSYATDKSLYP